MKTGLFLTVAGLVGMLCGHARGMPMAMEWDSSDAQALVADAHDPVALALVAPVLDQQQITRSGGGGFFWGGRHVAQTFKPSVSGLLTRVDSYMDTWDSSTPTVPFTIRIVDTVNGVPSGAVLGSLNFPAYTPSIGWQSLNVSAQNIYLQAEHQYAYVLLNDDPSYEDGAVDGVAVEWSDNHYSRGQAWEWTPTTGWAKWNPFGPLDDSDMVFRTWMSVPEPAIGFAVLFAFFPLRRTHRARR